MNTPQISCIILAGGQARRMQGRDKGLVDYHGRPLIGHVIERVSAQVADIVISANRNIDAYRTYSNHVIADTSAGFTGPLTGIASCLPYCRQPLALVVACDMPYLPDDLASRLLLGRGSHELAVATREARFQLALLVPRSLQPTLDAVLADRRYALKDWLASRDTARIEFDEPNAFINLNSRDDLGHIS